MGRGAAATPAAAQSGELEIPAVLCSSILRGLREMREGQGATPAAAQSGALGFQRGPELEGSWVRIMHSC